MFERSRLFSKTSLRALKGTFVLTFALSLGCSNIYEPLANKDTDEALYETALKAADKSDWDTALTAYTAMGAGFKQNNTVRESYAGALAGKCGLNFINYLNRLSTVSFGSNSFFKYLMNAFTGVTISPSHCTLAENQIKLIWAEQNPTASQQLFMAVLSMAKMGTYLRAKADKAENSGGGNDTVDGTFDACAATPTQNNLTDAEVKEVATGLSLFLINVAGFAASLSGDVATAVTAIDAVCSAITPNPCTSTDSASVSTAMVNTIRDMLNTSAIGLGACAVPSDACCNPTPN